MGHAGGYHPDGCPCGMAGGVYPFGTWFEKCFLARVKMPSNAPSGHKLEARAGGIIPLVKLSVLRFPYEVDDEHHEKWVQPFFCHSGHRNSPGTQNEYPTPLHITRYYSDPKKKLSVHAEENDHGGLVIKHIKKNEWGDKECPCGDVQTQLWSMPHRSSPKEVRLLWHEQVFSDVVFEPKHFEEDALGAPLDAAQLDDVFAESCLFVRSDDWSGPFRRWPRLVEAKSNRIPPSAHGYIFGKKREDLLAQYKELQKIASENDALEFDVMKNNHGGLGWGVRGFKNHDGLERFFLHVKWNLDSSSTHYSEALVRFLEALKEFSPGISLELSDARRASMRLVLKLVTSDLTPKEPTVVDGMLVHNLESSDYVMLTTNRQGGLLPSFVIEHHGCELHLGLPNDHVDKKQDQALQYVSQPPMNSKRLYFQPRLDPSKTDVLHLSVYQYGIGVLQSGDEIFLQPVGGQA